MDVFSVRQKPSIRWLRVLAGTMLAGAAALTLGVVGCGSSGGGGSSIGSSGSITTGISDPAQECNSKFGGTYDAVYVTVEDVEAHIGSGSSQTGWVDLTPDLKSNPVQVDLLESPTTPECFLATLGVTSGLKAGNYQQIRIFMADNGSNVTLANGQTNSCGGTTWNCVVVGGTPEPLDMPSNAQTGLKIPPGQVGGGNGLSIAQGQGLDLDIDVNACQSVVQAGHSGKYLFKPTLRADEVGTNPLISGIVYEASLSSSSVATPNGSPTPVGGAKVWLERQLPANSVAVGTPAASSTSEAVENLLETTMTTTTAAATSTNPAGSFEFCPVGPGTYDIVISAATMPSTTASSLATITTGVTVTSSGGPNDLMVPLVPGLVGNSTAAAATISGTFTTQSPSDTATATGDNIQYAATQAFNGTLGQVWAFVPEFANSTNTGGTEPPTVTTGGTSGNCTAGTCSAGYTLYVPPGNPVIGAASTSGAGYAAPSPAPTPGVYSVWASASTTNSSSNPGTADCTPSELITDALTLTGTPPLVNNNGNLTFESCNY